MIRDLRHLLVVIHNDSVIAYGTSVSGFLREVRKIDEIKNKIQSDSTMRKKLIGEKKIDLLGSNKKVYTLQKVL